MITLHLTKRNPCMVVIANFDLNSPGVKRLVVHKKRKEIRCKLCKAEFPRQPTTYSDRCESDCFGKKVLKFEEGPFLSNQYVAPNLNGELLFKGTDFSLFSSDARNLRREIYPLIVNELLMYAPPIQGQRIILNGLPYKTVKITPDDAKWEHGTSIEGDEDTRVRVVQWDQEDLPIPFLEQEYHKVFEIVAMPPNMNQPCGWIKISENVDMRNDIHEADNSVFFFGQFFPQSNQMIIINDGDAIPIGLMRVSEDYRGSSLHRPITILRTPNKSPKEKHKYDYTNLTQLYSEVSDWDLMKRNGVQNPVMTLNFLIIICGTDFFEKPCFGIGPMETNTNVGIWGTFMKNIRMYSHLVQLFVYGGQRDPTQQRRVVVDEDMFKMFIHKCYFEKHMKNKDHGSLRDLEIICSKKAKKSKLKIEKNRARLNLPSDEQIKVWCRHITWNLQYWMNACRNIYIDPFEKINDMSYYGFEKTGITASVHPIQKQVDDNYKRNFYSCQDKKKRVISKRKREIVSNNLNKILY